MERSKLFRPPDGPFAHMDPFRGSYITTRLLRFFRTIGINFGPMFNTDINNFIERMAERGIPPDQD